MQSDNHITQLQRTARNYTTPPLSSKQLQPYFTKLNPTPLPHNNSTELYFTNTTTGILYHHNSTQLYSGLQLDSTLLHQHHRTPLSQLYTNLLDKINDTRYSTITTLLNSTPPTITTLLDSQTTPSQLDSTNTTILHRHKSTQLDSTPPTQLYPIFTTQLDSTRLDFPNTTILHHHSTNTNILLHDNSARLDSIITTLSNSARLHQHNFTLPFHIYPSLLHHHNSTQLHLTLFYQHHYTLYYHNSTQFD